jgi:hypothetical protein
MSSSHATSVHKVVPAQLAFLTIYNPSFGDTDETAYDQIFYYFSPRDLERRRQDKHVISRVDEVAEGKPMRPVSQEEEHNERLRKVGLARGMVEFAK